MPNINETLNLIIWLIALLQFILGFYVLVLNPWHATNRLLFVFLAMLGISSIAQGALLVAKDVSQTYLPSIVLAMTLPAIPPALVLTSQAILKQSFLWGRRRWLQWLFIGLAFLPAALTLIDLALGTGLYFTGINPETYNGGFIVFNNYANGRLADLIYGLNFGFSSLIALTVLLYLAVFDKDSTNATKRLAWLLFVATVAGAISNLAQDNVLAPVMIIITQAFYLFGFAFVAFLQMALEKHNQRGRLQTRLTWLTLATAIPLIAGLALILTNRARVQLERVADQNLENLNYSLSSTVALWLDSNQKALENLALQPEIVSMDAQLQKPILTALAQTYRYMYLVSTVDLDGIEVTRSDNLPLTQYDNTPWFQEIIAGSPLAIQAFIGRDVWVPDLVVALPINALNGDMVGVAMFSSSLREIAFQLRGTNLGEQGVAFLVDENNQLLVHSSWADMENRSQYALHDMSDHPAVSYLDQGNLGSIRLLEEDGKPWHANVNQLSNEWGIVFELPESELLAPIRGFQRISWVMLVISGLLLFLLMWISIRQGFQPIRVLTETATTIAKGDLKQMVYIETQDELEELAKSFNTMTAQLRVLIGGLEERVAERTQALNERAFQLQVAAQVGSEVATYHDVGELMQHVVTVISNRFGFYHSGIYLIQRIGPGIADEFAVLQAVSSEGGRLMLARDHKHKVGEKTIIGQVASSGVPSIALDVGEDAVSFNNPDLPLTRSEMALPLKARGQVIGVLDVHSTKSSAFTEENLTIMQILADQIAVAIENARLLIATEEAYNELQLVYGARVKQMWKERLADKPLVYTFDRSGAKPLEFGDDSPQLSDLRNEEDDHTLHMPIVLRGQRIGSLILRRGRDMKAWTEVEKELVRGATSQLALAIENTRLLEEIQQRALQEETINLIAGKMQRSLNLDAVMRTAVKEIGQAINIDRIQVRLTTSEEDGLTLPIDPDGHPEVQSTGDDT